MAVPKKLCRTKSLFPFSKFDFCARTKVFEEALNAINFLDLLKKFGPAQNILGPVEGQGKGEFFFVCAAFLEYMNF